MVCNTASYIRTVYFCGAGVEIFNLRSHIFKDVKKQFYIGYIGKIFDNTGFFYHNGRRNNCDRGVLTAPDDNFAVKGMSA